MTLEALENAIARLIAKRHKAYDNPIEQARLNNLLDKIYDKKYTMLEQALRLKSE